MTQAILLLCFPPSKGCTSWQMWTRAPSWSPVTGRQSALHLQELQVLCSSFVQGLGNGQSQGSGLRIKVEGRGMVQRPALGAAGPLWVTSVEPRPDVLFREDVISGKHTKNPAVACLGLPSAFETSFSRKRFTSYPSKVWPG